MCIFEKTVNGRSGQVIIIALIFMTVILVLVGALVTFVGQEAKIARNSLAAEQALQLADAGIEKAVWQLNETAGGYSGETGTVLGTGVFDVSVAAISGSVKEITATGYAPSNTNPRATRRIKVKVSTETTAVSFVYGVHVGGGGLLMENSSQVIGNVYSHGNVEMRNTSSVTGDVLAALDSRIFGDPVISGAARANEISDASIGKNASSTTSISNSAISGHAYADTITGSDITKNAYYQTSISGSTVGGSTFPGTAAPGQLPEIPLAITDTQIDDWETVAASGGVHTSPCPYEITSGTVDLGPIKINCDFTVSGTAIVNINGPIWVNGSLDVKNSAQVKLSASYGTDSEVIIADLPSNRLTSSQIIVQNSGQILGSGSSGSYIMVISRNNSAELGGGEAAIQPRNTTVGAIYYAPHGKILIENSTSLKEAEAYLIHMRNSSTLTYESGLADSAFTAGPGASWVIVKGTWRETN